MGVPPFVGVAVKVTLSPAHIELALADMVTLAVGGTAFTVTAVQLAVLVPQLLLAVTHIFPDVVPKVTVMEVVPCPAVIEAPGGAVHV